MNSRRCASSWHAVKTASNWSTMNAGRPSSDRAASSARRALRSAAGVAVGSNTVTGPAIPGAAPASSRSRGTRPARSTDDLPAPDGPTSISGSGDASAARETSVPVTSSRPKNQRASSASNLASPRYGVPVRLPGGRRARVQRGLPLGHPAGVGLAADGEDPDQLLSVGRQVAPGEVVAGGADRSSRRPRDLADLQPGALSQRRQLAAEVGLGSDPPWIRESRIVSHWSPHDVPPIPRFPRPRDIACPSSRLRKLPAESPAIR